ncbi:MAG: glycosyltransferase [Acidimicrobiaceae bacterium]|nr:glycosyltransferase [Acidimicrobiaceae bacterium]
MTAVQLVGQRRVLTTIRAAVPSGIARAQSSTRRHVAPTPAVGLLDVHQFVPVLLLLDAVGNHTLRTHQALQEAGIPSSIWSAMIDPGLRRSAAPVGDFQAEPRRTGTSRVLVYQAASESNGIVDLLLKNREPKVISYHNFTPAEYFDGLDDRVAASLRRGVLEVRRLAEQVRVAIAASDFNATELRGMGIEDVEVIPPYLGPGLQAEPDPTTLEWLRRTRQGIDLLFVGRVVPHKGHPHLIRVLAALRAAVDPKARLFLVGPPGPRKYMRSLRALAELVVGSGVYLVGGVTDAQLAAYYKHADVFVSMSEHEGFGIPLVEAMRAEIPIVAYDSSAVAETLGGAGITVRTTDPAIVAEVVAKVVRDEKLCQELRHRQLKRAAEVESCPRGQRIIEVLQRASA